jgi:membrane-bound lytic murein transglycosylase B
MMLRFAAVVALTLLAAAPAWAQDQPQPQPAQPPDQSQSQPPAAQPPDQSQTQPQPAPDQNPPPPEAEMPDAAGFPAFIQNFRQDALAQGISAATLDHTLTTARFLPHVIELDRRQPELTLTFQDYIDRVVTPDRIDTGRAKLIENKPLLDRVSARYGVQPQYIVALWGIETNFGHSTGGYSVISALATLAYEGRRATFFRKELINALIMVDRQHVDPRNMTGSWAGAMGESQFMPSSFLAYAVSWKGGAAPDIWHKREDVFASIANYLAQAGWHGDQGWGMAVTLPANFDASLVGLSQKKSLNDWAVMGLLQSSGAALPDLPLNAALIEPAGADGPAFLVFDNFRAILKWNNSSFFATAVGYLADGID